VTTSPAARHKAVGRTFTLDGGERVTLLVGDLFPGEDLDEEAGWLSSTIGLVGELLGQTTHALEREDAAYRRWRAGASRDVLASEPKTPEWKIKHEVENDPKFEAFKNRVAALEGDSEFLRAYHDALRTKSSMIRARVELRGGERRSQHEPDTRGDEERGSAGGVTRPRFYEPEVREPTADRAARVREALANGRKSPKEGERQ